MGGSHSVPRRRHECVVSRLHRLIDALRFRAELQLTYVTLMNSILFMCRPKTSAESRKFYRDFAIGGDIINKALMLMVQCMTFFKVCLCQSIAGRRFFRVLRVL